MGNWSRDTMADKAITSPKSFPKCSEGNLGRETHRICQPLALNSLSSACISPSSKNTLTTGQREGPEKTEGSLKEKTDACTLKGSKNGRREDTFFQLFPGRARTEVGIGG
jgi:hypothetical protein